MRRKCKLSGKILRCSGAALAAARVGGEWTFDRAAALGAIATVLRSTLQALMGQGAQCGWLQGELLHL